MKLTKTILGIAAGAMLTTGFALQAQAQDQLPLDQWDPALVGNWLREVGLGMFEQTFVQQHVDGASLRMLSREDLNELGVHTVGQRLQILRAIADLTGKPMRTAAGPSAAVRAIVFDDDSTLLSE